LFYWDSNYLSFLSKFRRAVMSEKKRFVVIGCGGAGGPAAILTSKINPDVDVTVIRAEPHFIVR
jgi:hypothetical protein